jgi:hypothetical protein
MKWVAGSRGLTAFAGLALLLAGCEGDVLDPGGTDPTEPGTGAPHSVSLTSEVPPRVEPDQPITFRVHARAQSGTLREVGVGARVTGAGAATTVLLGSRSVEGSSEVQETFSLTYEELRALLPEGFALRADRSFTLEPSAYAIHSSGSCVAAVEPTLQQLACTTGGTVRLAAGGGTPVAVQLVDGRTVPLPSGLTEIGDVLVHAASQRLFVSNLAGHTVEVLDLTDPAAGFAASGIRVGSRPWGMTLSTDGSAIFVANSGGTNFSRVPLASRCRRSSGSRFLAVHALPAGLRPKRGSALEHYNYADRPRHLAQDATLDASCTRLGFELRRRRSGRCGRWSSTPRTGAWTARLLFPEGLLVNTPPAENRAVTASEKQRRHRPRGQHAPGDGGEQREPLRDGSGDRLRQPAGAAASLAGERPGHVRHRRAARRSTGVPPRPDLPVGHRDLRGVRLELP